MKYNGIQKIFRLGQTNNTISESLTNADVFFLSTPFKNYYKSSLEQEDCNEHKFCCRKVGEIRYFFQVVEFFTTHC